MREPYERRICYHPGDDPRLTQMYNNIPHYIDDTDAAIRDALHHDNRHPHLPTRATTQRLCREGGHNHSRFRRAPGPSIPREPTYDAHPHYGGPYAHAFNPYEKK